MNLNQYVKNLSAINQAIIINDMKFFSLLSRTRVIGYLLVITFCLNCKKDNLSTNPSLSLTPESISTPGGDNLARPGLSSQTRKATFLNNLNNFQAVFGNQNYPRANPKDVAADDNIYTRSSKLFAISDSTKSFMSNSISSLALQGFGFTIPDDATIVNIAVRVKRFKKGTPSVGDHILSVMQRYQCGDGPCRYGIFWTYRDTYTGKIYPGTETEYVFSQSGIGNNGGFNHDEAYEWTPAIVNHQYFGVRIDNYVPIGKGSVELYYDLVEVTVQYSQP
jgi:hypothetical protein